MCLLEQCGCLDGVTAMDSQFILTSCWHHDSDAATVLRSSTVSYKVECHRHRARPHGGGDCISHSEEWRYAVERPVWRVRSQAVRAVPVNWVPWEPTVGMYVMLYFRFRLLVLSPLVILSITENSLLWYIFCMFFAPMFKILNVEC